MGDHMEINQRDSEIRRRRSPVLLGVGMKMFDPVSGGPVPDENRDAVMTGWRSQRTRVVHQPSGSAAVLDIQSGERVDGPYRIFLVP